MNNHDSSLLRDETERLRQEIHQKPNLVPTTAQELMSKEFPPDEWLVENLIPLVGITALSGAPASYKTWATLSIAIAVAAGDILFEHFPANQTGVLIMDEENGDKLTSNRLRLLPTCDDLPIFFFFLRGFKLSKENVATTITQCKERGIGLIIFDSLIRIHSHDENDASKMSQVFDTLKQFNREGISVLFTHHHRKQGFLRSNNPSEDMRGSSDIRASVDCHLAIHRGKPTLLTLTQTKNRYQEELPPFSVSVVKDEDGKISLVYEGEIDESQTKKDEAKLAIIQLIEAQERPMYQKEIREKLTEAGHSIGEKTLRIALDELKDEEKLFTMKGERNKTFYSLQDTADGQLPLEEV